MGGGGGGGGGGSSGDKFDGHSEFQAMVSYYLQIHSKALKLYSDGPQYNN